jgi:hypothetical protein
MPFDCDGPPPNGFVEKCCEEGGVPCIFYFGAGALALQRQRMGNGSLGVHDPNPGGLDTGLPPPANAATIATYNTAPSTYHWGVQATFGVQQGPHAIEVTGYYISPQTDSGSVADPSRIDLPFGGFPAPKGFDGDNNLWRQADLVSVHLSSQLGSAELNYRYIMGPELEWIFGFRYFDQRETLDIFTDDDGIAHPPPNSQLQATYETRTINQIIGGQIGFESNVFLIPDCFALGLSNKNMVGVNFMEADNALIRGDGLVVDLGHRTGNQVAGLIELNAFATLWFTPNIRLRGGYQAMWIFNVPQARDQVDFDTTQPVTTIHRTDSIFYHGPRVELQIAF